MKPLDWLIVAICVALFLGLTLPTKKARAQEDDHQGHSEYSKWSRPDTTGSCCDAKVWFDVNGRRSFTGHCYEASAKVIDGQWWVLFDNGQWWKVPNERLMPKGTGTPNPAAFHICENYENNKDDPILCGREPVGDS